MKNITVRISDVQHRKARVWAAARGTSLSAMVEHLLQNLPTVARAVRAILASELEAKGIAPSPEAQALISIIKGRVPNLNKTHRLLPVQRCNTTQPAQPENDRGTHVLTFPDVNSQVASADFHLRQQIVGGGTSSSSTSSTNRPAANAVPTAKTAPSPVGPNPK